MPNPMLFFRLMLNTHIVIKLLILVIQNNVSEQIIIIFL